MKLPTFFLDDLPNMASHCSQSECGYSIYRGVLVQWDEDHDDRVLRLLDELSVKIIEQLLVVQEHEGAVCFIWKGKTPRGYEEGADFIVKGDVWFTLTRLQEHHYSNT